MPPSNASLTSTIVSCPTLSVASARGQTPRQAMRRHARRTRPRFHTAARAGLRRSCPKFRHLLGRCRAPLHGSPLRPHTRRPGMASGTDNDDPAELDDAKVVDVEDGESPSENLEKLEDEDGLAPEAGSRRPSLVSLLLLLAGAIWIVVALLKLDGEPTDPTPSLSMGEQVESQGLPDVDDPAAPDTAIGQDSVNPPESSDDSPTGEPIEEGVDSAGKLDLGSNSERGPPEGSLLAGKRWPQDYAAPEVVYYKVKRGGSMKIVANLYKIYHHEIEALNPGVDIDQELPPGTKLVVYKRKPGSKSESIGFPGSGSVVGAMPMVDGPGRELKHTPWKGWATTVTVATLDMILREWARRYPTEQPILVGNMSAREGGRLEPHSSHQSGRDVDLSYPQNWDRKEELNWRTMNSTNLNRELTWELLELLRESGGIEAIFIDSKLQKLLYDHAISTQRHTKVELEEWMEYPRPPGSGSPIIQHVRGHEDHIHVRFKCTDGETECQSREREGD
ncbi:penicillin-insensitive murein endopeptidase [Nannocystaceae bacterium ST9]